MLSHVEHVKDWHVIVLSERLREADKAEIKAISGLPPLRGLIESVSLSSVSYSIMEEGIPVAMYGARKTQEDLGLVWMLASEAIERNTFQFLRKSVEYIDALHDEVGCAVLTNLIDKRNTLHHKWVKWIGFSMGKEEPHGPYGLPFYRITRIRKSCAG